MILTGKVVIICNRAAMSLLFDVISGRSSLSTCRVTHTHTCFVLFTPQCPKNSLATHAYRDIKIDKYREKNVRDVLDRATGAGSSLRHLRVNCDKKFPL